MANSQDNAPSQHPDLLAAVVLHTLVSRGRDGMGAAAMAVACERDPSDSADIEEIEGALRILLNDDLAKREDDLYRPTRAAIRAAELSF
ncbi:MAG TPA: hypothetical protein VIJ39_07245 [Solirubrobacteraceae bacterium]